jgi:hypothetical protein
MKIPAVREYIHGEKWSHEKKMAGIMGYFVTGYDALYSKHHNNGSMKL